MVKDKVNKVLIFHQCHAKLRHTNDNGKNPNLSRFGDGVVLSLRWSLFEQHSTIQYCISLDLSKWDLIRIHSRMLWALIFLLTPVYSQKQCIRSIEKEAASLSPNADPFKVSKISDSNNYAVTVKKYYIQQPYQIHGIVKQITVLAEGKKTMQVDYRIRYDKKTYKIRYILLPPGDYERQREECVTAKKGRWAKL
ncbi:hypothetical protein RB195_011634 [Necator americanus]|uniref:Cystatin domain protein n=1 Tax=Necator americanus TaxID=51031 RepID=A0ABR1D3C2_NECAM